MLSIRGGKELILLSSLILTFLADILQKVLNGAGFSSSNDEKYKSSEVSAAIKNSTGATPWLVCSHDSIQEIRLCLEKDFTVSQLPGRLTKCERYIVNFNILTAQRL